MPMLRRHALRALLTAALLLAACSPTGAQTPPETNLDSGGALSPEQAAYDVTFYDLELHVAPSDSSIAGRVTVHARLSEPLGTLVLDLDHRLRPKAAWDAETEEPLGIIHAEGKLRIDLGHTRQPGDMIAVTVRYEGRPRIAPRPPWDGGFTWARTPSGAPWIATSNQVNGADLWWPVKDHVADEPDSVAITVTVPAPLVVASNGRLRGVDERGGERTYRWFVSQPINVYNVALNIAPYEVIETTFTGPESGTYPVQFFVLPEDLEKGRALMPEILDHLRFFEETVGPYPFRADKYGVAQTPHLGMEHQTIIAYGANFDNRSMTRGRDWGFDALHQHELAHEWWGNLVTNADWSDMWIHEGFGSYMQPLYAERIGGDSLYHAYMASQRGGIANRIPLAPPAPVSTLGIYGGDIYSKGSWLLHTLRFAVGDEAFFEALRRFAYPTPESRLITDGSQARFATTTDFERLVSEIAGEDYGWFFDAYARTAALPRLDVERLGESGEVALSWSSPSGLPFTLPVEVEIDGERRRVAMPGGTARIRVPEGATLVVDPDDWLLREIPSSR